MSGAGSGLFKDIGSMGMERTSSWADVGDDEFDEWDLPEPTVMGGAQTAASPRSRLGPGDAGGGRGPGDGGQGGEAGAGDDDGGGAGAVDRAEIPAIVDPFAAEVADDGDTDSDDESDGEGAGADVDAAERAARGATGETPAAGTALPARQLSKKEKKALELKEMEAAFAELGLPSNGHGAEENDADAAAKAEAKRLKKLRQKSKQGQKGDGGPGDDAHGGNAAQGHATNGHAAPQLPPEKAITRPPVGPPKGAGKMKGGSSGSASSAAAAAAAAEAKARAAKDGKKGKGGDKKSFNQAPRQT